MSDRATMFATVDHLDGRNLLSEWSWLIPGSMSVLRVTAFGDVFCADADGGVYFLNTRHALLERIGDDEATIDRLLDVADNRRTYLLSFIVRLLRGAGRTLSSGQCYSFKHPIHLGGEMDTENVEVIDLGIHLSVLGQLHRQTRW